MGGSKNRILGIYLSYLYIPIYPIANAEPPSADAKANFFVNLFLNLGLLNLVLVRFSLVE